MEMKDCGGDKEIRIVIIYIILTQKKSTPVEGIFDISLSPPEKKI